MSYLLINIYGFPMSHLGNLRYFIIDYNINNTFHPLAIFNSSDDCNTRFFGSDIVAFNGCDSGVGTGPLGCSCTTRTDTG